MQIKTFAFLKILRCKKFSFFIEANFKIPSKKFELLLKLQKIYSLLSTPLLHTSLIECRIASIGLEPDCEVRLIHQALINCQLENRLGKISACILESYTENAIERKARLVIWIIIGLSECRACNFYLTKRWDSKSDGINSGKTGCVALGARLIEWKSFLNMRIKKCVKKVFN